MYFLCVLIAQFRYFNIQPKTIDITMRLWGINPTNSIVYLLELHTEVYCFRLNFNISKLGYFLFFLIFININIYLYICSMLFTITYFCMIIFFL